MNAPKKVLWIKNGHLSKDAVVAHGRFFAKY